MADVCGSYNTTGASCIRTPVIGQRITCPSREPAPHSPALSDRLLHFSHRPGPQTVHVNAHWSRFLEEILPEAIYMYLQCMTCAKRMDGYLMEQIVCCTAGWWRAKETQSEVLGGACSQSWCPCCNVFQRVVVKASTGTLCARAAAKHSDSARRWAILYRSTASSHTASNQCSKR
jgi:hypothetical protein